MKICDCCASQNVRLKQVAIDKKIYYCSTCHASVGCHVGTDKAFGKMALPKIRRLRSKLHSVFDPLWKNKYLTRSEAYDWLAVRLEMFDKECHVSDMNEDELLKAIEICKESVIEKIEVLEKRKLKKYERHNKRARQSKNKINRRKRY